MLSRRLAARRARRLRTARVLAAIAVISLGAACAWDRPPTRDVLVAPYESEQLWAVVPPANESGVSVVDTAAVADEITRSIDEIRGVHALPVNRVLQAMRQLQLHGVATTGDVHALLNQLGADGLVVGSVTVWDPYPPPTMGLALQLFTRTPLSQPSMDHPEEITRVTSGEIALGQLGSPALVAQAASIFDARDQVTRASVEAFAASRHEKDSAYGTEVYLVSMDLFTQFVSHRLVRDLFHQERSRLIRTAAQSQDR
jgi:hypothetical protein